MRLLTSVAVAAFIAAGSTAHADIVTTFDATGVFQSGATLSGTIMIDTTSGAVESMDLSVSSPDSVTFDYVQYQTCTIGSNDVCQVDGGPTATTLPNLDLDLGSGTLAGYGGGNIGSLNQSDYGGTSLVYFPSTAYDLLQSGSLSVSNGSLSDPPAGTVPEPSGLVLLGTGALSMANLARRRFA